ncbi:MAG: hypothetical protein LIP77_11695, partial [Planctomycetes bacterium]|nr:hypothetical protein [Planctomycetota bacterium]
MIELLTNKDLTMKYIFVALCSLLLAVAWSEDTAPHPAVTGITSTYQGGRVVQVRWNNPAISAQQRVACEIYRDGELVYRGILRENDEETDGEVWSGTTTQTFKDTLAHPGSTHEYTVVYRTEDGVESLPALTSVALALPAFSGLTISYAGGRNVTLSFLLGVNYFPDLKYRVYRDGEKIGEMPFRGSGTLENGNTWDGTGSRQYFTDTQATPGESHEYRLVMDLYPGCPLVEGVLVLEIPLPAVRNLTVEYRGGRTVQIALYRTINTFPDLVYEIYRDGILVGSMPHDTAGTAENGDYWTNGGLWQYFNDTHATPGATHEYRLVANLYPGCPLVEEIRTLAIALPAFSSLVGDYRGGRTVQIAFYRTMNTFPDLIYEIYRDGVLVGAMPHDTAGTAENGDYWSNGGFWQYYNDTHATPGENHEYRVVANLYSGGPVVEQFLEVPIPLPEFSSLSYVYRGGRSVQFQFLKTMNTFPDLVYEIYRDGAFVGSMPHDTSGTAENGDTWSNGGS